MEPDDDIILGRALDESRACLERIESLRRRRATVTSVARGTDAGSELTLALANFELHGATLHSLARWYPAETRVRLAALEWELLSVRLSIRTSPATHL
jgi:hypothetical protein